MKFEIIFYRAGKTAVMQKTTMMLKTTVTQKMADPGILPESLLRAVLTGMAAPAEREVLTERADLTETGALAETEAPAGHSAAAEILNTPARKKSLPVIPRAV